MAALPTYYVEVSREHFFLQRPDVGVQEVEPVSVVINLRHVDVPGGNILVAAL